MIADISITEKSFGPKILMKNIKFSIDDGEKVGVIGRNGVGKSTLFGILDGTDTDFTGDIIYKRGVTVVATAQEHHDLGDTTVLQYVLQGLPEYAALSHIIETYPETPEFMGGDMRKISEYTDALQRFDDKGFYQIEEQIERELENFQLVDPQSTNDSELQREERFLELTSKNHAEGQAPPKTIAHRRFSTLSGGQKRLVEVVKVMHSDAHLALVDEPTNHMDYVAKDQFISWMKSASEAMLVITHDRDVLREVDRIVELKDGSSVSYKGNYDAYLRQNATSTGSAMNEFEMIEKRIANLKVKVLDYQRLKEKSRNPGTIQKFKRLEEISRRELAELQAKEKPTFWIDKESASELNYKTAAQYDKFKAKNIRMNMSVSESRSKHVLVSARELSLGYGDTPLFAGIDIDLREGEALELRGRNGAGKTTLIKAILETFEKRKMKYEKSDPSYSMSPISYFTGSISVEQNLRIGAYEQEVSQDYFGLPLGEAIEKMYLDKGLTVSDTIVRGLLNSYLFTDGDRLVPLSRLSGGQKARFQIISMLANDPQLLILDEPTNHLDLPSIEELEAALNKYSGAILYVSHDSYFQKNIGGEVVTIGRS